MPEIVALKMETIALLVALLFIALTCFLFSRRRIKNLPPGPYPLPIIGNLHQFWPDPHEKLAHLSRKYGPLMSMRLGSIYSVVVTSPEMAKEILVKHGQVFSGRLLTKSVQAFDHDKVSVGFLPINAEWRDMRKICQEMMFSHHKLDASEGIRRQKLQQLLDYVQKCCENGRAVDIREATLVTTLNLMSGLMFSTEATEFESELTKELREITWGIVNLLGMPDLGELFPILKPFDLLGMQRNVTSYLQRLHKLVEGYLNERLESRRLNPDAPKKNDFIETVVDIIEGNDYKLMTTDHLTHLMMDLFVGGTDTNVTTIEWAMAELVIRPDKMAKLREEIKSVAGDRKLVEEWEISRMPYLQAVIKETLRLHTPAPLLFPHKADSDQEVNGYLIPKGAMIFVNAWAIARDPSIWKNPEAFEPERFLGKDIDVKGHDFELIPFGSGRRQCAGMPLATRIVPMATAALVSNFEWKLEEGATEEDNKGHLHGPTVCRAVPLRIIPIKP